MRSLQRLISTANNSLVLLFIIPFFIGSILTGCSSNRLQRSALPCPLPPPAPSCQPEDYNVVSIDTSKVVNGVKMSLKRVVGASSLKNEWALLPIGTINMLLEGEDAASSVYTPVKRTAVDRVEKVQFSNSDVGAYYTYGTIIEPSAVMGDASVAVVALQNNSITSVHPSADELITVNSNVYWDGHPTVSSDGRFLVFASDRRGTTGGTDLWYSVRTATSWSVPQILEGGVNTPCDELSPFIVAKDSIMLFASAGHSTVGGYDLFEVVLHRNGNTLTAGTPRNLGQPLNSRFDELFPRSVDTSTMYFSSNRPRPDEEKPADFDVFVLAPFAYREQVPIQQPRRLATVTGTVINQNTNNPVADADVTATDVSTHQIVGSTSTDTAGDYQLSIPVETEVEISAQAPDLFFDEMSVVVPEYAANDTFRITKPFVLPEIFVLRVNFPTAVFDNPYEFTLDSNGVETKQTWQQSLDMLASNVKMSGKRLKKLVLIGHTDDVDDDASNMTLGKNRVNFVMDELQNRGIERTLLEGRSAGESMLPARRKDEPIELWRKRARRVELVKVMQ